MKGLVGAFNPRTGLLCDYEPFCGPSFAALPSAAGGGLQVSRVQPQLEAVLVTLLPAVTLPPQQRPAPRPHPRHRGVVLGLGVGVAAQPATTTTSLLPTTISVLVVELLTNVIEISQCSARRRCLNMVLSRHENENAIGMRVQKDHNCQAVFFAKIPKSFLKV